MELSSRISIEEEKMRFAADKAVVYFSVLPHSSGNWDTFIPKYLEVITINLAIWISSLWCECFHYL